MEAAQVARAGEVAHRIPLCLVEGVIAHEAGLCGHPFVHIGRDLCLAARGVPNPHLVNFSLEQPVAQCWPHAPDGQGLGGVQQGHGAERNLPHLRAVEVDRHGAAVEHPCDMAPGVQGYHA